MGKLMPLAVFTASVHFLSPDKGGRQTTANQGYQPLLHFAEDNSYIDLVFVHFMDRNGEEIETGKPLPKDAMAEFRVYNERVWSSLRERIREGVTFDLSEGPHVVAHATIQKTADL